MFEQFKKQLFSLGKVFVSQTVVWYKLLVNFFLYGKNKRRKNENRAYIPPRAGGAGKDFRVS